jgi:hypothetical protein
VGAVIVLAVLVAALVARSSPSHPFVETSPHARAHSATSTVPAAPSGAHITGTTGQSSQGHGHFDWITTALAAILLLLVVMFLWGRRIRLRRRRRERRLLATGPALDLPPEEEFLPDELAEAVDETLATIERGPVSEAVIACWVRVEDAAEQAGMPLRATETSTEFADRVLGAYGVQEPVLRRLSALYREARFSAHTMTERSRDDARACLRQISDDLGRASTPEAAS